jgi:hypothetical protein
MESKNERESREIREFWESLTPEGIDELLNEISRKSSALLDFTNAPKPRRTRKRRS